MPAPPPPPPPPPGGGRGGGACPPPPPPPPPPRGGAGRPRRGSKTRAGPPNHGNQDHLHVVRNRKDVLLVDKAVPRREDPAGRAGERRRDAEGRTLKKGGFHADDGGRLFVLADRQ